MAPTNEDEASKAAPKIPRPAYTPLPIHVYQLPPLIPHNPLSVLQVGFVYLKQLFFPPKSFPSPLLFGQFSPETSSIHVIDERSALALWKDGFFGKGNLSRSDPSWLDRERRRLGIAVFETAEEVTARRRVERRAFKQERARKERDTIEAERNAGLTGNGKPVEQKILPTGSEEDSKPLLNAAAAIEGSVAGEHPETSNQAAQTTEMNMSASSKPVASEPTNQEHLQLELVEAFFLAYALGVLCVRSSSTGEPLSTEELFHLCIAHASFPPQTVAEDVSIAPDNHFLINYVAYHHFRSLGWVVRNGVKFGVDLLLYNRGPVFAHAEFAVCVVPAYSHAYWKSEEGTLVLGKKRAKPWHWLHMVNRVQTQVRKTLVVCFVEVPPPFGPGFYSDLDISSVIRQYTVREIVVRRWVPNRSRD